MDAFFINWLKKIHKREEIQMDSWLIKQMKDLLDRNEDYNEFCVEENLSEADLITSFNFLIDMKHDTPFENELCTRIKAWFEKITGMDEKYFAIEDFLDALFHADDDDDDNADDNDDDDDDDYDADDDEDKDEDEDEDGADGDYEDNANGDSKDNDDMNMIINSFDKLCINDK